MLTPPEYRLINGREFDAVPACLYRARSNAHARLLANHDWLLRGKPDGRYHGVFSGGALRLFKRTAASRSDALALADIAEADAKAGRSRPLADLERLLKELEIDAEQYALTHQLPMIAEPTVLEYAGKDRYRRPLWLDYSAKSAWLRMQAAAARDDLRLEAISGYRSHQYQLGIFRRKLSRGQTVAEILTVNAAPGFSEHHSGRALDISALGEPAAEATFQDSPAFAWLQRFGSEFGFRMSFPPNNPHGISYEPWHWFHIGND